MTTSDATRLVLAPDGGRVLALRQWGHEAGYPIFLFHGLRRSSTWSLIDDDALRGFGIRLVCFDRPGYGDSARQVSRDVAATADDVWTLAADLQLERFSVAGLGAGGPHALACAARLSDRVYRAVVRGCPTPPDRPLPRAPVPAEYEPIIEDLGEAGTDRDGMVDDVIALHRDWYFHLAAIRIPVTVWGPGNPDLMLQLISLIPGARVAGPAAAPARQVLLDMLLHVRSGDPQQAD